MVGFFQTVLPWLYASPLILVTGYLVLFATPALQAVSAALTQISPCLEDAARGLGRGPLATFREVTLPLVRPGLVGAWTLVFILCMRELAATLILRPPGLDTLPVRIWIHTMDVGPVPTAALLALVLVALVSVPWLALVLLGRRGIPIGW
jgi:iron(III) transport system permease protein